MKTRKPLPLPFFISFLSLAFLCACSNSSSSTTQEPGGDTPTNFETIGPVPADGILETVTWNLEWYGVSDEGPKNEDLQTQNFLTVLDQLHADLYAFEEIGNERALNRLVKNMSGYKGVIAKNMVRDQKTAFVYNAKVIDPISHGLIESGQDYHNWASGRFPFYFEFNYHTEQKTYTFFAVVIHAKCCPDKESYDRRKGAAKDLYDFLSLQKPNANLIVLGDFNDDMDTSIYQSSESPYIPFLNDVQNYKVVSKIISDKHQGTTVKYEDAVDHIIISNELFEEYVPNSAKVMTEAAKLIKNYGETTSDHYPVGAKFDL